MSSSHASLRHGAFQLLALVAAVNALPAPAPVVHARQETYRSDPADGMSTLAPEPTPSYASGSLYGNPSLIGYNPANPSGTSTAVVPSADFKLAEGQTEDGELGLFLDFGGVENFQPIRGGTDAPTDPGPRGTEYERINSDIYAPPETDSGTVSQAKWPFGLSHNRHGNPATAGWARQQNINNLPAAVAMAGVDFYLAPFTYRELHWHQANEWALMLKGSVRIAAVDTEGQSFFDDVNEGDVWFFPAGVPHSIQAKSEGSEFLLVFDQGSFDESGTDLVSELFELMPREVLAKNFRTDVTAFEDLPVGQLYIFPGTPAPPNIEEQVKVGPNGMIPQNKSYSYHWSEQKAYETPGGTVKFLDSASFPIASNFAAALVTLEPGAMREIHWHPTSDEWNFFLQGQGRITIYSAPDNSQTFDFQAGDVGYIPVPDGHYFENTGTENVVFLEILQAPRFTDISVNQWLGLTPTQIVKDTLHLPDNVIANLPKTKPIIIPGVGGFNATRTNYTGGAL